MRVVASYAALVLAGMFILTSHSVHCAESNGGSVEFGSKGIVFRTADTSSEVKMQFRLQAWSTYNTVSMEDLSASYLDGLIRRARLKFGGHLFDPSIEFKIELGFSRSDISFGSPDHPNLILDAIGYWRPTKDLRLGFGQTKLPGNRQRVVSSSEMEFPDRTIVNGAFNIDRDGGFFAFWTPIKGSVVVNLAGALTTGEGRNQPAYDSSGLAYTGRVELLPFGAFHDKGDYIEGDLYREPTPKVSLGFTGHYNDRMGRTRGQLGNYLFQNRSSTVLYADGLLKWSGLAVYAEWAQRLSDDPITYNSDSSRTRSVFVGTGYMGQVSYTFPNMLSIAGRVGYVDAGDELKGVSDYESSTEFASCISYYINEHRIKLQFEIGGDIIKNKNTGAEDASFLHSRFNVEVGI
jgi:phosphate-selective porin OprO and OprP